jgi:hypothetical protein
MQKAIKDFKLQIKNVSRFLVKAACPATASMFLWFAGVPANKEGREKRVLVMFGGGVGDVAKRSVICGYVEKYLKGHDVYYLMPYDLSLPYAHRTIRFDHRKAKTNPWYYFSLVNELRKIGFGHVIVLLPAWEGFLAALGNNILPQSLYRYVEAPPLHLAKLAAFAMKRFRPRTGVRVHDIALVSFYDPRWTLPYFPSDVHRMAEFFSQAVVQIAPEHKKDLDTLGVLKLADQRTIVELSPGDNLAAKNSPYCVMGIGSSYEGKNWPPQRFGEVASFVRAQGLRIVVVGGAENEALLIPFKETYRDEAEVYMGKTKMPELCRILAGATMVIANDTSFTHLAIALRKPTVCLCFGPQKGADSCYGYQDINHWFFWEKRDEVMPPAVIEKTGELLEYLKRTPDAPKARFAASFFDQDWQNARGNVS